MSPTQRSKQYLERLGYRVAIVERWNPFAKVRQDVFGCIDLLAVQAKSPVLAVQVTTGANLAARIDKAGDFPELWQSCGARFVFHGWRKVGVRGKRKQWQVREIAI